MNDLNDSISEKSWSNVILGFFCCCLGLLFYGYILGFLGVHLGLYFTLIANIAYLYLMAYLSSALVVSGALPTRLISALLFGTCLGLFGVYACWTGWLSAVTGKWLLLPTSVWETANSVLETGYKVSKSGYVGNDKIQTGYGDERASFFLWELYALAIILLSIGGALRSATFTKDKSKIKEL